MLNRFVSLQYVKAVFGQSTWDARHVRWVPAKISQFLRKKSRSAASIVGLNFVPMEAVFVVFVGWTWNLTISSAGLNEVDLGHLSSITSTLSTVAHSVISSSAARASDNASKASAAVLFLARSATSGSLARVMIPLGPGILSFMYP